MSPRPIAWIALLSLIWGSEWIANMELSDLPHLRVIAIRCFIAALVLLPFAIRKSGNRATISYGRNCLLGIGLIVIPVLLAAQATNISSGLSVVLFAALPLVATLMEGDTGISGAPYLLGGLLAIAFLVRGSLSFSSAQGLSILWITLSVFCVALSMVKAREWLPGQNRAGAILVQLLAAGLTIGLYSVVREGATGGTWASRQMMVVALLGIVGSAIAYLIFYRLLGAFRASQVAVLQWVTPVIGVIEAAIWLKRFPAWEKAGSCALAAACAVLLLKLRPDRPGTTVDGPAPLTLKITLL